MGSSTMLALGLFGSMITNCGAAILPAACSTMSSENTWSVLKPKPVFPSARVNKAGVPFFLTIKKVMSLDDVLFDDIVN